MNEFLNEEGHIGDWRALEESTFFPMWASAAIDEMLSALHERLVVGLTS